MYIPNELVIVIFNFIKKITDKRQFLKTCKLHNTLLKGFITEMSESELNYFKISDNDVGYDEKIIYHHTYLLKRNYCVEKFMMELCYDLYFNMIPKTYLTQNMNNPVIIKLLIKYGKLELLQLAINNKSPNFLFCGLATEAGQLNILIWLIANGYSGGLVNTICPIAARNGHLHILKWARENGGCGWSSNTCLIAAKKGHLHILKWAKESGYDWNNKICENAAFNGHLHVLKWARENGCDWGKTCAFSTVNGHLNVLKWARENGCDWDSETCSHTAFNNHLNCLIWARENGCDWDKYTIEYAIDNESWEVLQWARENGCPE